MDDILKRFRKSDPEANSSGLLAAFFRKILIDTNMVSNINRLVKRHAILVKGGGTLASNNLKLVTASSMTFKTLMYLLFNILRVKQVDITFKLTMPNNKVDEFTLTVDSDAVENDNKSKV